MDTETVAVFDMGDHLLVTPKKMGPCAACREVHAFFICRGGRTRCVTCDREHLETQELNARVTFGMMFSGPVLVQCTCRASKDPSDLFKCMCPAGYAENRPQ